MLGELAHGFDVSIPSAGLLLVSGVVVALGAPLSAAFTSAVDRRWLLAASMLVCVACHAASALAPNFAVLLAISLLLAIPAAIFTPQAAATVGALFPTERRAGAITLIFIGWSLATVGGMPLGGYVAHTLGWRVAFLIVAALSALALLGVWLTVPQGVKIAPLGQRAGDGAVGRLGAPRSALFCASRHVWWFGGLGRSRGIVVGSAGQRDALGPCYICRKFRSAGPARGHCSGPDVGVHRAQYVGNQFWAGGRCRYRGNTHSGRNDAGTTVGRRRDPAHRSGRVHSGSTVGEVRARQQVNADSEARLP